MGTLEYMEKELSRHKLNLERQTERNAPVEDIENLKKKVEYYTEISSEKSALSIRIFIRAMMGSSEVIYLLRIWTVLLMS